MLQSPFVLKEDEGECWRHAIARLMECTIRKSVSGRRIQNVLVLDPPMLLDKLLHQDNQACSGQALLSCVLVPVFECMGEWTGSPGRAD